MSNAREMYNEYHQALMKARVDSAKLAQENAIKQYEIDSRAKSYANKNATDLKKAKEVSKREYYKTYVTALGKLSEFDNKNPMHPIREGDDGKYYYDDGTENADKPISATQYMQYLQENKNIMQTRQLVQEGYINAIKPISEYDPDALANAKRLIRKGGKPPSGVMTDKNGIVKIVDKFDGVAKDIKQKTQEDYEDPDTDIEGYLGKNVVDFNKANPTLDPDLAGKMRNANDPMPSPFVIDSTPEWMAKHSKGTVGTTTERNPMTEEEAGNFIKKGGTQSGSNVSNSAGINSKAYGTALEKKIIK